VKAIEKRGASLEADVGRLAAELDKKSIKAPYDGVVLKRHVDRGEWLSPGSRVATIARVEFVDIIVNVPERAVSFTKRGMIVDVEVGGRKTKGEVVAVIPRGDVATRTFPVKVRVRNDMSLVEGMEARVSLPTGEKIETLIIHRDALVTVSGRTAVYAVVDSKAVMIPVTVVGYERANAGIRGNGLKRGVALVIKGNERIRNGQALTVLGGGS
jgi:RND family efflux transporter MFP subunit